MKNLQNSILRPHGIVVVCGPTGSGKTTTLYSAISRINTAKVNITTLEELEDVIGDLTYPIGGEKKGVIVMLTSALFHGYFGFIVLARNLFEAKYLYKELDSRLEEHRK